MDVAMCFYWNETLSAAGLYPDVRLLHTVNSGWISSAANNDTLSSFSAVCYYFARALKQYVPAFADVPIGLVQVGRFGFWTGYDGLGDYALPSYLAG